MHRLPSWKICGGLGKSYKMPPTGKYAIFLLKVKM
jgi:hypothetical protein